MLGLRAPCFYFYYHAAQQYLCKWINGNYSHNPWLQLEQSECENISSPDLPFITNPIKQQNLNNNTVICKTVSAWCDVNKITKNQPTPHLLFPIWHYPDFTVNNSQIKNKKKNIGKTQESHT